MTVLDAAGIVGSEPGSMLLQRAATRERVGRTLLLRNPVCVLQAMEPDEVAAALAGIEPMLAKGLFVGGYVAYEAGYALEPALRDLAHALPRGEPLVWLGCYDAPLETEEQSIAGAAATPAIDLRFLPGPATYEAGVETVRQWIARGDTYQANLTMDAVWSSQETPAALYRRLLQAQPVPYAAMLHPQPGWHVLSLSPELFFRREGDHIVTRPMKGTAPPGLDAAETRAQAAWLAADEKNRAENVMIVDLLRNDLGRICQTGTVEVSSLCAVERYPTVLQMTSTVEGRLRPEIGYAALFAALFPSGSIVGAPKIHTARLLHGLEGRPRGVYTGAIGWIAPDGRAEFNVAIRTVSLRGGAATLSVGAGITFDSVPREEVEECRTKTRFLTRPAEPVFSLIETLQWDGAAFPRLQEHLDRLTRSAEYFGFPMDRTGIEAALQRDAVRATLRAKVRLLLTREGEVTCTLTPLEAPLEVPLDLLLWPEQTCADDPYLRHKTTQRHRYDRACSDAQARGYADSLFQNERGEVTEGAIHNVLARCGGEWVTPPLASGVLPGIFRGGLLRQGWVVERRLPFDELLRAEAIAVCNAVRGLRQVGRLVQGDGTVRWRSAGVWPLPAAAAPSLVG